MLWEAGLTTEEVFDRHRMILAQILEIKLEVLSQVDAIEAEELNRNAK